MKLLPIFLLQLASLIVFGASQAYGETPNADTVTLTADGANSYTGAVATARDNAICNFHGYRLNADEVRYNRVTHTVEGIGHAKLICPNGNSILGPQITVNNCLQIPVIHVVGPHAS